MNIQYETGKLREPILNVSTEVALNDTAQKISFLLRISSVNVTNQRISSQLLKKSLMGNFIFCAV